MNLNENLVDVTVAPGASAGASATLDWRPKVSGFTVAGSARTTPAGSVADLLVSGDIVDKINLNRLGAPGCQGLLSNVTGSGPGSAGLLVAMRKQPVYPVYRSALPLLGIDGSLAAVGKTVIGKEHMSIKSGATVEKGQVVAISMAGYIEAKSGRALTSAVFVNDAGPLTGIGDSIEVFEDEAQIAGIVYRLN